ncbi:MAG: hypothetical protein KF895_15570 [Parvibaculum sp.]|nr:hypothetical protein [Parvibaculum sp.]
MSKLIGYEGGPAGDYVLAWGSAALRVGDELRNPGAQLSVPWDEEEVASLVEEGALFLVPKSFEIPDEYNDSHVIVLQIARKSNFAKALHIEPGRVGGIISARHYDACHLYVFADEMAFEQAARQLCTQIAEAVLKGKFSPEERNVLLEAGLVASSKDPYINALRVWFSPNRANLKQLVCSRLDEESCSRFKVLLERLETLSERGARSSDGRLQSLDYVMKYDDGLIPDSGGIDSLTLLRFAGALRTIDRDLSTFGVPWEYPFLHNAKGLHLETLLPRSAEFHFATVGDTLADRLARLVQLQMLARALEGDVDVLSDDPKAHDALFKIANIGEGTRLRHKPIGETAVRPVESPDPVKRRLRKSDPFQVLGYQCGLAGEGRVQLAFFPARLIWVSASKDDHGETPQGLLFLETQKDFLFQPTIYTLVRELNGEGKEHFYLRAAAPLVQGRKATITAFPSSVVSGAIIYRDELSVALKGGSLHIDKLGKIDASANSAKEARGWLDRYLAKCFEYELQDKRAVFRLTPPNPVPTSLGRILASLDALGGVAKVTDLVTEINDRFQSAVRVNNTRREVWRHTDLLEFAGPDDKNIQLTERGRNYLRAYKRAGGVMRVDPDA